MLLLCHESCLGRHGSCVLFHHKLVLSKKHVSMMKAQGHIKGASHDPHHTECQQPRNDSLFGCSCCCCWFCCVVSTATTTRWFGAHRRRSPRRWWHGQCHRLIAIERRSMQWIIMGTAKGFQTLDSTKVVDTDHCITRHTNKWDFLQKHTPHCWAVVQIVPLNFFRKKFKFEFF